MPSIERPDPPYVQIARGIEAQIRSGELAPGDLAPSARTIAEEWGVAHATAAKVLAYLRSHGLIENIPGRRGSFVAKPPAGPQQYARSVMRRGRIYPEGHYAVIEAAELVEAPERIIDALGLEPGAQAIRRERVTFSREDQPLSASVSWFDGALAETAPKLLQTGRILNGTTQYIADSTGRARSPREKALVWASRATDKDAQHLRVAVGDPVLRGRNWYWDIHGGVLEYGESASGEELAEEFEYTTEEERPT
jgi:DNA-binding GntR family transcriptional regulator